MQLYARNILRINAIQNFPNTCSLCPDLLTNSFSMLDSLLIPYVRVVSSGGSVVLVSLFGHGKDRGWWGVSAIGLRVGLD